jgi:hypothetical protein
VGANISKTYYVLSYTQLPSKKKNVFQNRKKYLTEQLKKLVFLDFKVLNRNTEKPALVAQCVKGLLPR